MKIAQEAGADWIGNPDQINIVEQILQDEPKGIDVVFECCGQQDALNEAVELLKPDGQLSILGIPAVPRVDFDIHEFRHKELNLRYIRRQNGCVQHTLDIIETGQINVDFMVTHRFSFEQSKEAFELVADYRDGVVKAMIEMDL